MSRAADSRSYWDRAASTRPAWYIATGHEEISPAFFEHGSREVDELFAFCGLRVQERDHLLEIGCGAGRMTGRLAQLAGRVTAMDVSAKMLELASEHLVTVTNVDFVLGNGQDLSFLPDSSVDVVFSYVTLQHVPSRAAQLNYLVETERVLRPGGRAALQVRAPGLAPAALDVAGQLARALRGRQTLRPEWRGVRLRHRDIDEALAGKNVRLEFRMRGRRHLWVIVHKPSGGS